jgi:hypothetical protein
LVLAHLLNNGKGSLARGLYALEFAFFLSGEILEAFDFSNQVETVLFVFRALLEAFVLSELLVAHSDYFGVEDHAIHFLDVVLVFVEKFLSAVDHILLVLLLGEVESAWGQLSAAHSVEALHVELLVAAGELLLLFVLLDESHVFAFLLLGLNLGDLADELKFVLGNNRS